MLAGSEELLLSSGKGKLAEVDTFSREPRFYCEFFGSEEPKISLSAVHLDPRTPLLPSLIEVDPAVTRSVVALDLVISVILRLCTLSEILISAIERVAIFVIHMRRLRADNFAMKKESFRHRKIYVSRRIEAVPSSQRVPVPLACPLKLSSADFSNKSAREGHKAIRLIQRLDNRLAMHATLGHGVTPNNVAVFSRTPILAAILGAATGFEEAPCT